MSGRTEAIFGQVSAQRVVPYRHRSRGGSGPERGGCPEAVRSACREVRLLLVTLV